MARGAEKEVSWKIGGEFSGEIDCKVYLGQDWFLIIFAAPAIGEKLCIGIFCSRIFFLVLCTINISFTCKWAFVIQFATNLFVNAFSLSEDKTALNVLWNSYL